MHIQSYLSHCCKPWNTQSVGQSQCKNCATPPIISIFHNRFQSLLASFGWPERSVIISTSSSIEHICLVIGLQSLCCFFFEREFILRILRCLNTQNHQKHQGFHIKNKIPSRTNLHLSWLFPVHLACPTRIGKPHLTLRLSGVENQTLQTSSETIA